MSYRKMRFRVSTAVFFVVWLSVFYLWDRQAAAVADELVFKIQFTEEVREKPFSGRVYLFFSSGSEPRFGPNWFNPKPFLSAEVSNVRPGDTISIPGSGVKDLRSFPKPLSELRLEGHKVQAVARFNPHDRNVGNGPGNGYSNIVTLGESTEQPIRLVINSLAKARVYRETESHKLLQVRSKLLSEFYKRDVDMRATVILPAGYDEKAEQRYPVIFRVPGFGGTHFVRGRPRRAKPGEVQFITVALDPSCPLGHHVFADSANNGPVGKALVEEFIPELDRRYRTIAKPGARFLTGHSSGGWSTLWLQVAYPGFFGGTWSTAPDPVDFRDFQRINLYRAGENMYDDADGKRRPLARQGKQVMIWYKDFSMMEWALDYGGQLHSFEACFSPRGPDGKPLLVWDRQTGAVNTKVAKTWEKYDIRLILERNHKTLAPKLTGKLHVIMGAEDTFYLEGATILLAESLKKLGSDAEVEIVAGRDHMNLLDSAMRGRIREQMVATFRKSFPDYEP